MKIKSIELNGFKSFMNKTTISYPDGITAVVGPNGSGKSNVIEAIRWVLGEKSAKSLRSNSMLDVIFSGSKNHNALNLAEVSINFDNDDHFLNSDYSEITIKRKLYRNGDSLYYLNDNVCRLKDIKNLFLDTGLGEGSFSIISQGNVNDIIDGSSENRRQVIETAAGFFKYKKQKETTYKKLNDINQNLLRISDHTKELKNQIVNLEDQSIKAQKYLFLRHENRFFHKNRLIIDISKHADQKIELENSLSELKKSESSNNQVLRETKKERNTIQEQLNEVDREREKLHNSLLEKTHFYQDENSNSKLISQKESFNQQRIDEIEKDLMSNDRKIESYLQNIDELEKKIDSNLNEKSELEIKLNNINNIFNEKKHENIEKLIQNKQDTYLDLMNNISNLENQINYENQINQQQNNQSVENKKNQKNLKLQIQENKKMYDDLNYEIEVLKSNINQSTSEFNNYETELNRLKKELDNYRAEWYREVDEKHKNKAEYNSLNNLISNHNNFFSGSKNILKYKNELSGVLGAVSEFINTKDQYSLAIDTALGNRTQQIIVENQESASNAIQFLNKSKLGRTTFLPKNNLNQKIIYPNILSKINKIDGFIDIAANLIEINKDFNLINQYLLGNIIIANDLNSAKRISNTIEKKFQVVTLSGDVINAGGSITGGKTAKSNNGNISQKNQLNNLKNKLQNIEKSLENKEILINDKNNEIDKLNNKINNIHNDLENKKINLQIKKKEFSDLNGLIEKQNKDLQKLSNQKISSQQNISISEISDEINDKKNSISLVQKEINDLKNHLDKQNKENIELDKTQVRLVENIKSIDNKINNMQNQLDDFYSQRDEEFEFINHKKNKIKELKNSNDDSQKLSEDELNKLKNQINEIQFNIDEINDKRSIEQEKLVKLDKNIELYQNESLSNVKLIENLNNKIEINNEKLEKSIKELKENFDINLNQAISNFDEKTNLLDENLVDKLEDLTKFELNKLGPVDTDTINIFNETKERYEFMNHQKVDLENSRDNLNKIMDEIDVEVKSRFESTFNVVNEKFSQTFKDIFDGGSAHLKMSDSKDILNTGIEIVVQPPGKKYRDISLLSGGEKSLTALALLFGILQVKTVPFIILDEAESALDPANVDRFARYMSRLKEKTQFIVITHRKETMVYADNLYGITMQNSGISNVLSVRLDAAQNEIGGSN